MISIVLIEPETSGNVGAIARVMKNFGFSKLVIVNPKCDIKDDDCLRRAKHAKDVLKKAKVLKRFPKMDYLIATTAKLGTDYNLRRTPMAPEVLGKKLSGVKKRNIGIVFGRESHGLFNEEIEKCDSIVAIPSNPKYPTLNLSHSVGIICYELSKHLGKSAESFVPIGAPEKKQIDKLFTQSFNKFDFKTKEKKQTQKLLWKRIIGKAMLSKRESFAVMGFLRKILKL